MISASEPDIKEEPSSHEFQEIQELPCVGLLDYKKSGIMRQKMTQNGSERAEKCQQSPHCCRHAWSHYLLSAVRHKVVLTHQATPGETFSFEMRIKYFITCLLILFIGVRS